jgi:hypothetical protein
MQTLTLAVPDRELRRLGIGDRGDGLSRNLHSVNLGHRRPVSDLGRDVRRSLNRQLKADAQAIARLVAAAGIPSPKSSAWGPSWPAADQ